MRKPTGLPRDSSLGIIKAPGKMFSCREAQTVLPNIGRRSAKRHRDGHGRRLNSSQSPACEFPGTSVTAPHLLAGCALHGPGCLLTVVDGPNSTEEQKMRFEGTAAYVADKDLMVAVNAAIALERPLLVKGEPGTGKTELARPGRGRARPRADRMARQVDDQGRSRASTSMTRCRGCATASSATSASTTSATTSSAASCGTPSRRPEGRASDR